MAKNAGMPMPSNEDIVAAYPCPPNHPSIFQAALRLLDVPASEAVMVGDSVSQDIEGALRAGMRAVLVHRGDTVHPRDQQLASAGVPVVRSLSQLPDLILGFRTPVKNEGNG